MKGQQKGLAWTEMVRSKSPGEMEKWRQKGQGGQDARAAGRRIREDREGI